MVDSWGASGTELTPIATEDKLMKSEWLYMSDGGKATKLNWVYVPRNWNDAIKTSVRYSPLIGIK